MAILLCTAMCIPRQATVLDVSCYFRHHTDVLKATNAGADSTATDSVLGKVSTSTR